ncbi:hypothetical protein BT63DRAFT_426837 [Microthyrium microscopicum]|uniref:BTB domain-containing protein n=1 Tax=Microthyrium microscopicum TaxID=703497 RepID=A0A6A6U6X5_9PEZI|nr:hypothetical protein BT63DRAFT_426837 [Microthyrium microscopicum]
MFSSYPTGSKRGPPISSFFSDPSPATKKIKHVRSLQSEGASFQGQVISVLVGNEEKKFTIHADRLSASSEFFKRLLNSSSKGFLENATNEVRLPEHSPEVFELYAQFLYAGQIYSDPGKTALDKNNNSHALETNLLIDAITLADYLQDDEFHNAAIDALISQAIETNIWPVNSEWIGKALTSGSASLVKLLKDFCVFNSNAAWWTNDKMGDSHPEFWISVAKEMALLLDGAGRPPMKWVPTNCNYHRHKAGVRCVSPALAVIESTSYFDDLQYWVG